MNWTIVFEAIKWSCQISNKILLQRTRIMTFLGIFFMLLENQCIKSHLTKNFALPVYRNRFMKHNGLFFLIFKFMRYMVFIWGKKSCRISSVMVGKHNLWNIWLILVFLWIFDCCFVLNAYTHNFCFLIIGRIGFGKLEWQ